MGELRPCQQRWSVLLRASGKILPDSCLTQDPGDTVAILGEFDRKVKVRSASVIDITPVHTVHMLPIG